MIYDEFGRPIKSTASPSESILAYLERESRALLAKREAESRAAAVRWLSLADEPKMRVGDTVHVRLPKRYQNA